MPSGIFILVAMLVLAIVVAVVLPLAQKAAAEPFIDYEAERAAYVAKGQARYNKFSDSNDVTRGNFARATTDRARAAVDADLQALSQTTELVADPSAPTYLGAQNIGTRFKVAPPSALLEQAKKCEAKKGRDVCSALGTEDLSGCGVCILGGTAYSNPDNSGRHIGGMLILPEDQEIADEEAKQTGKQPVYQPSLGECPDGFFFVSKSDCVKAANRQDCKEAGIAGGFSGGNNIEGKPVIDKCAAAPLMGDTTYVFDSKNRKFTLVLRVIPPTGVKCYVKTGSNSSSLSDGKEFTFPFENVAEGQILDFEVVQENTFKTTDGVDRRAICLQLEGWGNDRIANFESSLLAVNGTAPTEERIFQNLRKFGTYGSGSIISSPIGKTGDKMLLTTPWIWGNLATVDRVAFKIRVPGTFLDPIYEEDRIVAPRGPLIAQKSTFNFLRAGPCLKPDQVPGKYSSACLKNLFVAAGGDFNRGKLVTDGLEKLNRIGNGSAETINGYLTGLYTLATRGKKPTGEKGTMTEINDAAMKMFGFEIVSPCEDIMEDESGRIKLIPKVGGLEADCLDHLWMNTGNDRTRGDEDRSRNTSLQNTYIFIGDRYSGLRSNEGSKKDRDAFPFTTCQRTGTLAPVSKNGKINPAAILEANKRGSVVAVQDFYSDIHKKANFSGGGTNSTLRGEHEDALQKCYGITRNGPATQERASCPTPLLLSVGQRISLSPASNVSQFTRHAGFVMWTGLPDGSQLFREDASFKVVPPLGGTTGAVSLEAVNFPGFYVTHSWYRVLIYKTNSAWERVKETEWFVRPAKNGQTGFVSLENNWGGGGWYLGKVGNETRLVRDDAGLDNISWRISNALA